MEIKQIKVAKGLALYGIIFCLIGFWGLSEQLNITHGIIVVLLGLCLLTFSFLTIREAKNKNQEIEDLKRIGSDNEPFWEVSCCNDIPAFFRALTKLCPNQSIFYIEGIPSKEIENYLTAQKSTTQKNIKRGTLWPRTNQFHVLLTQENLEGLAKLSEKITPLDVAFHLHIYTGDKMVLSWNDCFTTDTFIISKDIPESNTKDFSNSLNLTYKKEQFH